MREKMKRARSRDINISAFSSRIWGADKVKTLVFLKKIFEDGSFAATKDRTQNLPLCVFSGIEELALPIQDKLASLGVKFHVREISFSELIARHG